MLKGGDAIQRDQNRLGKKDLELLEWAQIRTIKKMREVEQLSYLLSKEKDLEKPYSDLPVLITGHSVVLCDSVIIKGLQKRWGGDFC